MTHPWFLGLALCLVVCATNEARMRTWSALGAGALAAQLMPPLSVPWYIVADTLCALLVMRHPAGLCQRMIGALFAIMVCFHSGWLLSAQSDWQAYYFGQYVIGWLQLAILGGWGLRENVGYILGGIGDRRGEAAVQAGIR